MTWWYGDEGGPLALGRSDRLVAASLDVLRAGQARGGAFVACPTFATYGYAWLRDGSFCAYALDRHGERDAAAAFHAFVARALLARPGRVEDAIAAARAHPARRDGRYADAAEPTRDEHGHHVLSHRTPEMSRLLPTRFTLDGDEEGDADQAWPNFQLDGYGTWLWALADHVDRGGVLTADLAAAAGLVVSYLGAAGELPCYDCWEEYGESRHTATRAAVNAGLHAGHRLLGGDAPSTLELTTVDGTFVKFDGSTAVDGSLLWLAVPFGQVAPEHPAMRATASRIERELVGPGGGVRRYVGDTFYGGGEWVILSAWLGWYRAAVGNLAGAGDSLAWVEAAATADGLLPEQLTDTPQDPAMVRPWVERWGPVATPLLWSHAMHLVLVDVVHNGA
jgi:GH15 family glucan-1,4-alpha-glucosidase